MSDKKTEFPLYENTSSIRIDHENKRIIFITKDLLLNQIYRDGPLVAKSFDEISKYQLDEISMVIADTYSLIFNHIKSDVDDYKSTCAGLVGNALSTFIASIEVARHGFRRPYGSIARGIIESLSVILHIMVEPGALENFHNGKLQSTKSISAAKKIFEPIGFFYGKLSNDFVHITKFHAILEPVKKFTNDEEPLKFILSTLRANAWLIYVVSELVFYEETASPRYWKDMGNGHFKYDPSDEEKIWQKKFLFLGEEED